MNAYYKVKDFIGIVIYIPIDSSDFLLQATFLQACAYYEYSIRMPRLLSDCISLQLIDQNGGSLDENEIKKLLIEVNVCKSIL